MKYLVEILFVILFLVIPLLVYGLFDIVSWMLEGNARYFLVVSYPIYCIVLLCVLDVWLNRRNKR